MEQAPSERCLLSIDGGGIRGLMTAVWLHALQHRLPGPLAAHVDVFAGTSTGALLAAALGADMTTEDIVDHYRHHGERLFPRGFARLANQFGRVFTEGLWPARYDAEPLARLLRTLFADMTLGALAHRTLISCFDVDRNRPLLLDSADPSLHDLPVWQACLASCALPELFAPQVLELPGRGPVRLLDGGLHDPNPAPLAVDRLLGERPLPLLLASFGTGIDVAADEARKQLEAPRTAPDLYWMVTEGRLTQTPPAALAALRQSRYYRFQVDLPSELAPPDGGDRNHLHGLLRTAQAYLLGEGGARLEDLAQALKRRPRPPEPQNSIDSPTPKVSASKPGTPPLSEASTSQRRQ